MSDLPCEWDRAEELRQLGEILELAQVALEMVNQYAMHYTEGGVASKSPDVDLISDGACRTIRESLDTLTELGWATKVSDSPRRWTLNWLKVGELNEVYVRLKAALEEAPDVR